MSRWRTQPAADDPRGRRPRAARAGRRAARPAARRAATGRRSRRRRSSPARGGRAAGRPQRGTGRDGHGARRAAPVADARGPVAWPRCAAAPPAACSPVRRPAGLLAALRRPRRRAAPRRRRAAPRAVGRAAPGAPVAVRAPPLRSPAGPPGCSSSGCPGVTAADAPLARSVVDLGVGGVFLSEPNVRDGRPGHARSPRACAPGPARPLLVSTDEESGRVAVTRAVVGAGPSPRTPRAHPHARAGARLRRGPRRAGSPPSASTSTSRPVADLDDGPVARHRGRPLLRRRPGDRRAATRSPSPRGCRTPASRPWSSTSRGRAARRPTRTGTTAPSTPPSRSCARTDLVPFARAVEAGAPGRHAQPPASTRRSTRTCPRRCRRRRTRCCAQLGFDGVAMTDSVGMGAVNLRWDFPEAAVRAVAAGADAVLATDGSQARRMRDALVAAVRSGRLPEARLDEAAARVAALAGADPVALACRTAPGPRLAPTDGLQRCASSSCGEAVVDLVQAGPRSWTSHPGGSPANVAVGLARLGLPTGLLARLSSDAFGRLLRGHLADAGVDLSLAVDAAEPSTLAVASAWTRRASRPTTSGSRARPTGSGPTRSCAVPLPGTVRGAAHRLDGAGARARRRAPEALLERLPARVLLSYDPNVRLARRGAARAGARRGRAARRRCADVVKASSEDLAWLLPGVPLEQVLAAVAGARPRARRRHRRRRGRARARRRQGCCGSPPVRVDVVDTVGAGDAFSAGLLAGLDDEGLLDRAALRAADDAALGARSTSPRAWPRVTCGRAGADAADPRGAVRRLERPGAGSAPCRAPATRPRPGSTPRAWPGCCGRGSSRCSR